MAEKFCDILIVGCELPGLIAGAFLAKRGLSVTVLNTDQDVGVQKKNIQPNLISHLDSRLFKTILGRLSISDSELGIVNRYDTPFQVVMPKHRIDVTVQRDAFYHELKREFVHQADAIRSFYSSLDELDISLDDEKLQSLLLPRGPFQHYKLYKYIKANHLDLTIEDWMQSLNLNQEIACFLQAQIKTLSNLHVEKPFSYLLAKLLANQNTVLFDVKGGIGQLKKIFLNKIEAYSGKVKNDVKIENILIEKQRAKGVKLGGFEGLIACKYLLWNEPSAQIEPWLPKNFLSKWLIRKIQKVKPQYYRFSIQYDVDPDIIPVGMKGNVLLVQDPDKELLAENFLHLHFYYPKEAESPSPYKTLLVTYLLPVGDHTQNEEWFGNLHQRITEQLQDLMPFSQGRIHLRFPKSDEKIESNDLLFPLEDPDFVVFKSNALQNPVYEVKAHRFQHLFPFPNRSFIRGLILCGSEILACLGFEGAFLLGLKTTDYVWTEFELRKKKGLKQRRIA
ncbi:MAG: hypothetical protein HQM15_01250 [Deltaproteobacteria bacterium]|nr:hypothetical protein [Deltaproteobacteria bacterium]